jgi:lipopolysaccharide exporter
LRTQFKFYPLHLLRSEIVRSSTVLISGTIIAQLISIFMQPVLRRLFSPESFGILSVYLSVVGMIVILCSLRYDDTIVLPKSDKESINLIGLSILISFAFNILVFLVVLLLGSRLKAFLNIPENYPSTILYLIPFGAFLLSTYQALNSWLIRKRRYVPVSINKLVRRSTEAVSQISFSFSKALNGLIFSDVIGQVANLTTAGIQSGRNGLNLKLVSKTKLRYVSRKYSDFPKFNLIPAFMSTCSYLLPPIFINKYYSPAIAGYFDLSKLLLSIPMALIASAISNVLLQRTSERFNNRESFLSELKPIIIIISLLAFFEIVTILLFGPDLFRLIFRSQWTYSGEISKIMVWSFAFNLIVSSFTSIFVSMRKIKIYSVLQFVYFIAILSLLFFRHLDFMNFLKVYVAIDVVCYLSIATVIAIIIYRYETVEIKNADEF